MNIISAAKWVIRTRGELTIFVVWHVPGISWHGRKVHAVCLFAIPMVWREPTDHFINFTSACFSKICQANPSFSLKLDKNNRHFT